MGVYLPLFYKGVYMIQLYFIRTDYREIGKLINYKPIFTLDINLKHSTDMLSPVITIKTDKDLNKCNYCYIDTFKRYYFIERIETIRKDFYRLHCKVDVLESFKLDILNTVDVTFDNAVKVTQAVKHANNTPERKVSYILTTIGG